MANFQCGGGGYSPPYPPSVSSLSTSHDKANIPMAACCSISQLAPLVLQQKTWRELQLDKQTTSIKTLLTHPGLLYFESSRRVIQERMPINREAHLKNSTKKLERCFVHKTIM